MFVLSEILVKTFLLMPVLGFVVNKSSESTEDLCAAFRYTYMLAVILLAALLVIGKDVELRIWNFEIYYSIENYVMLLMSCMIPLAMSCFSYSNCDIAKSYNFININALILFFSIGISDLRLKTLLYMIFAVFSLIECVNLKNTSSIGSRWSIMLKLFYRILPLQFFLVSLSHYQGSEVAALHHETISSYMVLQNDNFLHLFNNQGLAKVVTSLILIAFILSSMNIFPFALKFSDIKKVSISMVFSLHSLSMFLISLSIPRLNNSKIINVNLFSQLFFSIVLISSLYHSYRMYKALNAKDYLYNFIVINFMMLSCTLINYESSISFRYLIEILFCFFAPCILIGVFLSYLSNLSVEENLSLLIKKNKKHYLIMSLILSCNLISVLVLCMKSFVSGTALFSGPYISYLLKYFLFLIFYVTNTFLVMLYLIKTGNGKKVFTQKIFSMKFANSRFMFFVFILFFLSLIIVMFK